VTIRPSCLPVFAALALACAGGAAAQAGKPDEVKAQIAKRLEIKVDDIRPSPINGLYEVRSGAEVGYVSMDGRYYVNGDVFDITSKENLTEEVRKKGRVALLSAIKDQDAIVFEPKGTAQHTVTVFTDVGPGSDSWAKAESVWCSADRKDALTRAKKGEKVSAKKCDTPVATQYELGRSLGVSGTPGIFTDTGEYLAGYANAAYLAAYLAEPAAATAKN
jgi:thiol:disulfide interchange protein DsbC